MSSAWLLMRRLHSVFHTKSRNLFCVLQEHVCGQCTSVFTTGTGATCFWRRPKARRSAGRCLLPVLPRASRICSPHLENLSSRFSPSTAASGKHEQASGARSALLQGSFLALSVWGQNPRESRSPLLSRRNHWTAYEQSPGCWWGEGEALAGEMGIWNRSRKRAKAELWLAWTVSSVAQMLPAGVSWHFQKFHWLRSPEHCGHFLFCFVLQHWVHSHCALPMAWCLFSSCSHETGIECHCVVPAYRGGSWL